METADAKPDVFLDYCAWFQKEKGIQVYPLFVSAINLVPRGFETLFHNGEKVLSEHVVVATGFGYFKNIQAWESGHVRRNLTNACTRPATRRMSLNAILWAGA